MLHGVWQTVKPWIFWLDWLCHSRNQSKQKLTFCTRLNVVFSPLGVSQNGIFDVLLVNEDAHVTETSIANVAVEAVCRAIRQGICLLTGPVLLHVPVVKYSCGQPLPVHFIFHLASWFLIADSRTYNGIVGSWLVMRRRTARCTRHPCRAVSCLV